MKPAPHCSNQHHHSLHVAFNLYSALSQHQHMQHIFWPGAQISAHNDEDSLACNSIPFKGHLRAKLVQHYLHQSRTTRLMQRPQNHAKPTSPARNPSLCQPVGCHAIESAPPTSDIAAPPGLHGRGVPSALRRCPDLNYMQTGSTTT